jgi:hypothetical protein
MIRYLIALKNKEAKTVDMNLLPLFKRRQERCQNRSWPTIQVGAVVRIKADKVDIGKLDQFGGLKFCCVFGCLL